MANEPRQRFTSYVSPAVAARVRGAVAALQARGMDITLASLSDEALEARVQQLEQDFNGGQPWPDPGTRVGGRPRKQPNSR